LSFRPTGGFIGSAMTHEELLDGLKELLRRHKEIKADPGALTLDTRIDQIGFDSLSILDFIYDIEDRFKIQTQMADLVSMVTVRDLVNYVQQRLPQ
jgi:acyl carrier protein